MLREAARRFSFPACKDCETIRNTFLTLFADFHNLSSVHWRTVEASWNRSISFRGFPPHFIQRQEKQNETQAKCNFDRFDCGPCGGHSPISRTRERCARDHLPHHPG